MNMTRFRELLRRDGWLYAAIALCVVLALSVSAISGSSPDEETRIARVLSEIAGAGSVSVTIYTEDSHPCKRRRTAMSSAPDATTTAPQG